MKILITGATGFVGRHLVDALAAAGHEIVATVRRAPGTSGLPSSVEEVFLDPEGRWTDAVGRIPIEGIMHLAAHLTANDDAASVASVNEAVIEFGTRLFSCIDLSRLRYVVNTGTFAEYDFPEGVVHPHYYYSAAKAAFRVLLRYFAGQASFRVAHVVPFTVYGGVEAKKKVLDRIYDALFADEPVDFTPGNQVLDFVHVSDVVTAFLAAHDYLLGAGDRESELFVGTGRGCTLREITALLAGVAQKEPRIRWGGIGYRPRDTMFSVAPLERNPPAFHWRSQVALEEGVRLYWEERQT